jgi:hypothetical protein
MKSHSELLPGDRERIARVTAVWRAFDTLHAEGDFLNQVSTETSATLTLAFFQAEANTIARARGAR